MELNVAFSCDANYCRHLQVAILSLIDNNREFSCIHIYILDNDIGEKGRRELEELTAGAAAQLHFIPFDSLLDRLKTDRTFPLSAFGRLFLGEIIPAKKVLYLDCDSVINGSFAALLSLDMDGFVCAAVQDTVSEYYKRSIGLNEDDRYFNSGVLWLDLEQWRTLGMQQKALKMIDDFCGSVPHHDPGVINAICRGKILRLHPKYNMQCPMFEYTPKQLQAMNPGYYDAQQLREAVEQPVFIHFTEGFSNRPWRNCCTHPHVQIYRDFQNRTNYAGMLAPGDIHRNSRILRWIYRHLPFPVYRGALWAVEKKKQLQK